MVTIPARTLKSLRALARARRLRDTRSSNRCALGPNQELREFSSQHRGQVNLKHRALAIDNPLLSVAQCCDGDCAFELSGLL